MNAPRIQTVRPLPERRLLVSFVNGDQRVYDCRALMGLERFYPLYDEVFFKTVTVDAGGYGVSWNDEVDLSEYELWHNGAEPGRGLEQRGIALYQAGR
jgi:hypothetical protein